MYIASNNLTVSTPVLIQILEQNSLRITSDELGVFVYDSLYKEQIYCPYQLVKDYLIRQRNPIYKYYLGVIAGKSNPDDFDKSYASKALQIEVNSAKELIDLLLYYKAIVYCSHKLSRVRRLVGEYLTKSIEGTYLE